MTKNANTDTPRGLLCIQTLYTLLAIKLEDCLYSSASASESESSAGEPESSRVNEEDLHSAVENYALGVRKEFLKVPPVKDKVEGKLDLTMDGRLIGYGMVNWKDSVLLIQGAFMDAVLRNLTPNKSSHVYELHHQSSSKNLSTRLLTSMTMKGAKLSPIAEVIDGKIYVLAGNPRDTKPAFFEVYEPDQEAWVPLPDPPFYQKGYSDIRSKMGNMLAFPGGMGYLVFDRRLTPPGVVRHFVIGKRLYVYNKDAALYYFDTDKSEWFPNEALHLDFTMFGMAPPTYGKYIEIAGNRVLFAFRNTRFSFAHLLSEDGNDRLLCCQQLDLFSRDLFGHLHFFCQVVDKGGHFVQVEKETMCAILGFQDVLDRFFVCISIFKTDCVTPPPPPTPSVESRPLKRLKSDDDHEKKFLEFHVIGHRVFDFTDEVRFPSLLRAMFF